MTEKKLRKIQWLWAGAALAVGLTAGYFAYGTAMPDAYRWFQQREARVHKADNQIKIAPDTDLVQTITYLKCRDMEVVKSKPAEPLVGLGLDQLQKIYSSWRIDQFDKKEVRMSLSVDGLCREHAGHMFIGVKDGYVAVFWGTPGPKAVLKETTKIPLSALMPGDAAELRKGLAVRSRAELLQTLEGLQSK